MNSPEPGKRPPFFWLHIKKSAGSSARKLLHPYYKQVARGQKPVNFVQSNYSEYNDILNNFRIPLGDYQFRRSLFAKKYLYGSDWDKMYRFAFAREPVSRCLSAFSYLQRQIGIEPSFLPELGMTGPVRSGADEAFLFDGFLDLIAAARISPSIYQPVNLHFTTHTAPMWGDIVGDGGELLLSQIFRLEALIPAINLVFETCGLDRYVDDTEIRLNANAEKSDYYPNRPQIAKIQSIYAHDFEVYEQALEL